MSRKSNNVKLAEKQQDQNEFLFRSLDRNDLEITALMDLHRSIHAVKQAIIRNCGEETLLDLGEGKLQLAPSSDSLQVADGVDLELPPHESQHLCVDFLLRMKLRRKLMNRLSRRLLRVAHFMDGNDLQPPPVPKYGEQRLHLDPERIKAFSEHLSNREMAIRTIEQARGRIYNKEETLENAVESAEVQTVTTTAAADAPEQVKSTDSPNDGTEQPEVPADETQPQFSGSQDTEKEQGIAIPNENSAEHTQSTTAENAIQENEESAPDKSQSDKPDPETSMAAPGDSLPAEVGAVGSSKSANRVAGPTEDALEACYAMLTDYKDIYEKVVDPETGAVTYPALESERDTSFFNTSTGIGAAHTSMSVKEKEAEDQKWKTALLSRIPDQPTFAELGLENRVFHLEERRKRVMKEKNAEENKRAKLERSVDNDEDSSDDEDLPEKEGVGANDNKTEIAEEHETMDTEEGESASKSGTGKDTSSKGEDDEENGDKEKDTESEDPKEKPIDTAPMRTKPISLLPVPSFYEQDLKRVRLIQSDLMGSSLQDQARQRLEGVTREYNSALAKSNELFERHLKLQEELNRLSHKNAMMKSQIDMQTASLKEAWYTKLKQFNDKKLSTALPSRHGMPRMGTF